MVSRLGRLGGRLGHRGRGRPRRRVKRLPSKLSVAPPLQIFHCNQRVRLAPVVNRMRITNQRRIRDNEDVGSRVGGRGPWPRGCATFVG
jgi:hypothetical protein